jgi:hypothetical protein
MNRPINTARNAISELRSKRLARMAALAVAVLLGCAAHTSAAVIFVTTSKQKVSSNDPNDPQYEPGCSLQEAIFSANFDEAKAISYGAFGNSPREVATSCVPGSGADVIVLPDGAVFQMTLPVDDASNFTGPTATPLITSPITIEARGATFQATGQRRFRLFAIGPGGSLWLRNAYVTGFMVKGGDGGGGMSTNGGGGGGGGMGAGGAIFVHAGTLLAEASTFAFNGAIGGDGSSMRNWEDANSTNDGGGGGGGLGGNGGSGACGNTSQSLNEGSGGGGGGARGNGGPGSCAPGGGGGTVSNGNPGSPGFACGGRAGGFPGGDGPIDGEHAPCAGGGGGGGWRNRTTFASGDGGNGHYGGGGGGGAGGGGTGARGGFGGGGGAGWAGLVARGNGGDGGFGGGGGSGSSGAIDAVSGRGGRFGGNANRLAGGGGAALGGAIFNDSGTVTILNSTFTANFALHGLGGDTPTGGHAPHGEDAGAAVFSRNGRLTVQFSTFSENVTHSGGSPLSGIVVVEDNGPAFFTLQNSILANNGGERECAVEGAVTVEFAGNLITSNGNCGTPQSTTDPLLGPLQNNQGPTPTMAIAASSPARGAADPAIWVPSDQRGQERPSTGADIGAFELCLTGFLQEPCLITPDVGDPTRYTLTIAASPASSGTTTPAPGSHEIRENSVVAVTAQPNPGHYFLNWTGDVTDSNSPSTTVVMTQNRSATANFALTPDFSLAVGSVSVLVGRSQTTNVTVSANAAFDASVALSATGAPTGVTAAFAPASVLVAPNGSQASQVTVTVAAFVLPGTYSFNVVGRASNLPGPSPTTVRSVPMTVIVVASPAAVSGVIDTFADPGSGCIDSLGVANAFKAKLAAAQAMLDAGQIQQALNTLQALLRQLQAQQGKHLATECVVDGLQVDPTAVLIAQVQAIIAGLGGMARANPIIGSVADGSAREVAGAVVNLLNGSKKPIASVTTDATGLYYFAGTNALQLGTKYTITVTLPKDYKSSSPSSAILEWRGTEAMLGGFVLY